MDRLGRLHKSEYVLGLDPEKDDKKKRPTDKLKSRFSMFRKRVKDCLDVTKDEAIQAVDKFLADVASGKQQITLPEECAANDLFAFIFAPDIDRLIQDRPTVRDYWKEIRSEHLDRSISKLNCLVSGGLFSEVDLFPTIKKVPGGSTSGVALVSFNSSAFESYGWTKNDNATISREAAEACSTALNRLLHTNYPDPRQAGQALPKRNIRLSSDTIVCFWSDQKDGEEFCSFFNGLIEANPEEVKGLYQSIWHGSPPIIENTSTFYALTLTGTQGRAIVRGWFESTVQEVAKNLSQHFADLDIVRNTHKPKQHDLPPQFPLTLLMKSLAPEGDSEKIPAPLIAEVIGAALYGTQYPFSLLQRAIVRWRAEIGKTEWSDQDRRDARAALIKAVLNRRKRFYPETTHYQEVKKYMDPTNSSDGYTLGRLMAVLERLQTEALGDPNASVIDRFFSGASATPKSVFTRLLKNARHHARKGKDDPQHGAMVFMLERLIDELSDRFNPKQNGFPAHLDIEQQGLFVLGYHQMRKWLWMNKEERLEWEKTNQGAPRSYLWNRGN